MEPVDPSRKHFYISLVKSCVRGMGAGALIGGNPVLAGVLLIAAEVLGVAEEL
tara:strand:- start:52 stop:210 length:159 start_codon:yes stop_codon:yes gene_type:complete